MCANPFGSLGDYSASIDWGDGTAPTVVSGELDIADDDRLRARLLDLLSARREPGAQDRVAAMVASLCPWTNYGAPEALTTSDGGVTYQFTNPPLGHFELRDGLTGLGNHRAFQEELDEQIAVGRESGRPFALLFIDLDNFKNINDSMGHSAGDQFLIQVSRRIQDPDERARLKAMAQKAKPAVGGLIVRTASEGLDEAAIAEDVRFLTELWADQLKDAGVSVHAMHPGWADTPGVQAGESFVLLLVFVRIGVEEAQHARARRLDQLRCS